MIASGRSDEALVEAALSRANEAKSRQALEELLGRYQEKVYLWCLRYVRHHDRAVEMTQDILVTAWERLESFGGRSKFSSWLFAIVRNRCLNEVRRDRFVSDGEVDFDLLPGYELSPDRQLEQSESESQLLELIDRTLDETERKVVMLRAVERLPIEEITSIMGINSDSGARGVLQRARRKLRLALEESEDTK